MFLASTSTALLDGSVVCANPRHEGFVRRGFAGSLRLVSSQKMWGGYARSGKHSKIYIIDLVRNLPLSDSTTSAATSAAVRGEVSTTALAC